MTVGNYINTDDIATNRVILASRLQSILDTFDAKIYGELNGTEAHTFLKASAFSNVTIAAGIANITSMCVTLSAETGITDTLDYIFTPGGVTGSQIIVLKPASGHIITIPNSTGNIFMGGGSSFTLNGSKRLVLFCDNGAYFDMSSSIASGAGSVSSVGLSAPNIFSVAGTPVTGIGTLALTLATQVKNKIFVGPATGADAAPTFRLQVLADLPVIANQKILANGSGSSAAPQEIAVGAGLQIVSNSLSVTGMSGLGGEGVGGNIVTNGDFSVWERGIAAAPDNWVVTGTGATLAREGTIVKHAGYSAALTRVGNDCHFSFDAYAKGGGTYMRSRTYTFGAWVYATVASRAQLRVSDGTTISTSSYHTGNSTWQFLTVTVVVGASATAVNVGLAVNTGNTTAYIDGATLTEGASLTYSMQPAFAINRLPRRLFAPARTYGQPVGTVGITVSQNSSQFGGGYCFQTTSANADEFTFSGLLEGGTYTLSALGVTNINAAKIDWYVDGVLSGITGQDWYSGSAVFNVVKTGSITVIGDGYHVIKGKINGRNASNTTGFFWFITDVSIYPSAD